LDDSLIRFFSVAPDLLKPMAGDKGGLGHIPLGAFQYCEAMRTACAYGWYVFPLMDVHVMFDGYTAQVADEGRWRQLQSEPLPPEIAERWNSICPPEFRDRAPSALTSLFEPSVIQIWSGLFVQTAPGWALNIRPLPNIHASAAWFAYEAIVETDTFAPLPLFVNLRLVKTDTEILIPRDVPLFQVQPIPREAYAGPAAQRLDLRDLEAEDFDWQALRGTMRMPGLSQPRTGPGTYGAQVRRARKARAPGREDVAS
jgi:hypothetical protein